MNSEYKLTLNKTSIHLILLFLAAAAVTAPMLVFGIPNGNDLPQHYQFALTIQSHLQNGGIYPALSDASNFGFGDVGIRFYPPLAYYVLVFFQFVAGNWFYASILTFVFWFFMSGVGAYFWAREWFGENASLLAALIYIFAPYHANQIYNAFTYAEFAAASILPFCFLFVTRICRGGKSSAVVGLAISFALLILTHLPLTVIGSISLAVYSLASLPRKNFLQTSFKLGLAVLLGLTASAFYWVRMAAELKFLNHATEEFTSQAYDFHANFLAAVFYVSPLEYNDRSLWFSDLMLLVTCGLFIPSAIVFYRFSKRGNDPKLFNVTLLLICAVFFATPLSLPVWENFGVLQKVQFPWRWLAVITLSGIIFIAAGFEHLAGFLQTKLRPVALLAFGLIIAGTVFTAAQIIKPAVFQSREVFSKRIDNLTSAESYECWWAVWAKKSAFQQKEKAAAANRPVQIRTWSATEKILTVGAGEAVQIELAVFYYPHWKASVNEQIVPIVPNDSGAISFALPAESSEIRVWFEEPPIVLTANKISVISWLVLIISIFAVRFSRPQGFDPTK